MVQLGTVTLETPRLILRHFTADDALMMFANWAHDSAVTRYLTWEAHPDVQTTEQVIAGWLAQYGRPDFYHWAIVPKALGQPIGSIGAVRVHTETEQIEAGYCIGRDWWHQGYTSEAFAAVLRFWFLRVGANRVEARHDIGNPNSGGVMRKCGLTCEGTLRQAHRRTDGTLCDTVMYAILAEDYPQSTPNTHSKRRHSHVL